MPRKRQQRPKRTTARRRRSSGPREIFLQRVRKVRDESASECHNELLLGQTVGDLRQSFSDHLDRCGGTFPALFAGYAQEVCQAPNLERKLNRLCSIIVTEAKNWMG